MWLLSKERDISEASAYLKQVWGREGNNKISLPKEPLIALH